MSAPIVCLSLDEAETLADAIADAAETEDEPSVLHLLENAAALLDKAIGEAIQTQETTWPRRNPIS